MLNCLIAFRYLHRFYKLIKNIGNQLRFSNTLNVTCSIAQLTFFCIFAVVVVIRVFLAHPHIRFNSSLGFRCTVKNLGTEVCFGLLLFLELQEIVHFRVFFINEEGV